MTAVKVRRGDVRRAVIVRTRKAVRRPDGRMIRFDDNAAVLLNNKREMLGTRIGGVVSADLRMKGWGKIVSLAPKVSLNTLNRLRYPQYLVLGHIMSDRIPEDHVLGNISNTIHISTPPTLGLQDSAARMIFMPLGLKRTPLV